LGIPPAQTKHGIFMEIRFHVNLNLSFLLLIIKNDLFLCKYKRNK